ncbi:calcium-binding protein [Cognatishimia sp. F0-27]|uniref:calcium-binding protein n=1 Tax=Cognatishimia sp. F0-27 TaxID=2816855 RepID=UPI001D0BFAF3|nr:calcium-binding protein [Cognatishimia sp. F0-27]MCC1492988.1 hypothetical protein [Cognatishimia sp. F0-27]
MLTNFSDSRTFLMDAEEFYSVSMVALNSSGVSGDVLFAIDRDGPDGATLAAVVTAQGTTPDQAHIQHIHGVFDADGNPANSTTPTIANDMDGDGMVEVLEGLTSYGDVLLSLNDSDALFPMSDSEGNLMYTRSFDIDDDSIFASPVTMNDYSLDDVLPLTLREYVMHGVAVPDGIGMGTGGEVGGDNGFVPILPAAAGEIRMISQAEALMQLDMQERDSSQMLVGNGMDELIDGGLGMDTINAGAGDDTVLGGDGGDNVMGMAGADMLMGGEGDDMVNGGSGDDTLDGGIGMDVILGGRGMDMVTGGADNDIIAGLGDADTLDGGTGMDMISGGGGMDMIMGGAGADSLFGVAGDDEIMGDAGDDLIGGGAGGDRLFGGDGMDFISGGAGDDLVVGGNGMDILIAGDGDDIMGGGAGDDRLTGGAGADEFHFDAGTGTDIVRDFTQGEDVISLLDDGAISFANSMENDSRGDSDLSMDDFDTVAMISELDAGNDQQVVYSTGGTTDAMTMISTVQVEAYLAATDGTDTTLYYDDDWSTVEGREEIAVFEGLNTEMTVADFDVY